MTTGTVNYDLYHLVPPSNQWSGTRGFKIWSGSDRPLQVWAKEPAYQIYRDGKFYKIRSVRSTNSKPPKRARDVWHPYSLQAKRKRDTEITFREGSSPFTQRTQCCMQSCSNNEEDAPSLILANDQIKLVNKLGEKTRGSDFDLSVFLGEGHQTARMLMDSAIRIRKSYVHLRRGDLGGSARSLFEGTTRAPLRRHDWNAGVKPFVPTARNVAGNWLELQYGWRPLVDDAFGAAEMLSHQLTVPFKETFRVSVLKTTNQVFNSLAFLSGGTNFYGKPNKRPTAVIDRSHRRILTAIVSEPASLPALLGLLDPQQVVWELVPFSFVADWFIPIGDWMQARGMAQHLTARYWQSDLQKLRHVVTDGGSYFTAPDRKLQGYDAVIFGRTDLGTTLSVPMPEYKPLYKVASWQHCANAIALLTQMGTGKAPRWK